MPATSIAAFLDAFSGSLASSWDGSTVTTLASRTLPADLAGTRWDLLTGDLRFLWAEWWVATFGDPARLQDADYPELYALARAGVAQRFFGEPVSDINAVARAVARVLEDVVRRGRTQRVALSDLDRRDLVVEAGDPPRCWICGWAFPLMEIDRFLGAVEVETEPQLPLYVDLVMPRGRSSYDQRVNADHVVPVSAGGGHHDNLRLACGWCNRAKGAALTTYDAPTRAILAEHPRLGPLSIPHPLWVVRSLATVARCESVVPCSRTSRTDELTVAPRWLEGALTPANLLVTCREHDPWATIRWIPRKRPY